METIIKVIFLILFFILVTHKFITKQFFFQELTFSILKQQNNGNFYLIIDGVADPLIDGVADPLIDGVADTLDDSETPSSHTCITDCKQKMSLLSIEDMALKQVYFSQ